MVTFFQASVISSSMFLTAMAANSLSSNLTFNPIKPATGCTAWARPAIDPIGDNIWFSVYCLVLLVPFMILVNFGYWIILLILFVPTYSAIDGRFFPAVVGFLLVKVLAALPPLPVLHTLALLLRSRLMRFWYQFRIFFIPSFILLFMFVVVMADIAVSYVVVTVIAFSLWFFFPYPIGKLEQLIAAIIFGFLAYDLLGHDECSTDQNCAVGLFCQFCVGGTWVSRCVPLMPITDPFKLTNNSLPFNKYAFLTTHNSYAINGKQLLTEFSRFKINQEDNITQQLNNGVRALMLDTYDFGGDIWLCHSPGVKCDNLTAFGPAIDTMEEIEAFLSQNPSEIITLILEDYVQSPNGLTKLFYDSGLSKYWFPLSNMPLNGQDWPLASDMVANNQRLVVFTSIKSKQDTEGIAYQWNYMVENQYGNDGLHRGICSHRSESSPLSDRSKSLVLVNYFTTTPIEKDECMHHLSSGSVRRGLINMLHTCYGAAGDRWANFVAVDYYKSSDRVPFQAVNTLNGKLLCGCDDVHACVR